MNIYITNEHFSQTWFCFKEGKEKENLLELDNRLVGGSIYTHINEITHEIEFPAIQPEDFNLLSNPYAWCENPIIRFGTRGIELSNGIITKENAYFDGRYTDNFFNAEIKLENLDEGIIRCADISVEELITYAKYLWCCDMGLNYLFSNKARDIENKILIGKEESGKLFSGQYESEENDYNKALKFLRKMKYTSYLKTEHWKHFRNEAIKYYQGKCQLCGTVEKHSYDLHLHHNNYDNRGRETFNDVTLLCSKCHKKHHNK
ncbi:HNH endonuclease [Clostridium butyricum]|uniref:HNH endonuclease n=1 Tax=Clostridium butyricum TaxID=1492 RepID=UPI00374E7208